MKSLTLSYPKETLENNLPEMSESLRLPLKLSSLTLERMKIAQVALEPAIHSCPQITFLDLNKVHCP